MHYFHLVQLADPRNLPLKSEVIVTTNEFQNGCTFSIKVERVVDVVSGIAQVGKVLLNFYV